MKLKSETHHQIQLSGGGTVMQRWWNGGGRL